MYKDLNLVPTALPDNIAVLPSVDSPSTSFSGNFGAMRRTGSLL